MSRSTITTPTAEIRLFVSSTFADLNAERDELVKHIFPQIRKECEHRGLGFVEIDLRWGITTEQQAEAAVLPICLREIRRCRPYFLGIIGRRYGFVPRKITAELLEREPWIGRQAGRSVTELELSVGVFRRRRLEGAERVYLLAVEDEDQLPDNVRRLRARVRRLGSDVCRSYRDPQDLGQQVLHDYLAWVEQIGTLSNKDPVIQETLAHERFAHRLTRVFVGRHRRLAALGTSRSGNGLAIIGDAGMGKSALAANWIRRRARRTDGALVIAHFAGAGAQSVDLHDLLRRLIRHLQDALGLPLKVPENVDEHASVFRNLLSRASKRSPTVVLIDGIERLEPNVDLSWIPEPLPEGLELIITSRDGAAARDLERRGFRIRHPPPLTCHERQRFIEILLGRFAKTLPATLLHRVAHTSQTGNPLFLRVLIEEIRVHGRHENLREVVSGYLRAGTTAALYDRVLQRFEADFGTRTVQRVMCSIALSRQGVSQSELGELLGRPGQPIPYAKWAGFHLAAEPALYIHGSKLRFFHEALRDAVARRYLSRPSARRVGRQRIVRYFSARRPDARQIEELPWQLEQLGHWRALESLMAQHEFFVKAWEIDPLDVLQYWSKLEHQVGARPVQTYQSILKQPSRNPDAALALAGLLEDRGALIHAHRLHFALLRIARQGSDLRSLQVALGRFGVTARKLGQHAEAQGAHAEEAAICRRLRDRFALQFCLANQAILHHVLGNWREARRLHRQRERLCLTHGFIEELLACRGDQATLLQDQGYYEEALAIYQELSAKARQCGDVERLLLSLGNEASGLDEMGEYAAALPRLAEQEQFCVAMSDQFHLSDCLGNMARIHRRLGHFETALRLHEREAGICRKIKYPEGLIGAIGNKALLLAQLGQVKEARRLHREEQRLCRLVADPFALQICLGNRAVLEFDNGQAAKAMSLLKQQERICRSKGYDQHLQRCLGNQAMVHRDLGEDAIAMRRLIQQERYCRRLEFRESLQHCLGE